jgi:AGCS family alanine or glycine:cation symporter
MTAITDLVSSINGVVWGPMMLALILGTGLWLSIGLRGMPVRYLFHGFRLLAAGRRADDRPGEITPFQALMTSLAATVGTGNIAGVATAVALGGPGAIFWMWCTALVGMATKYAEAVLAVQFRQRDGAGGFSGGPMYYIEAGLGPRWKWLGVSFAAFGALAGFGIGNTVQSNSVADALEASLAIPEWVTGLVLFVLAGAVVLGGVRRIARVAEMLVPLMAVTYLGAGLFVVLGNLSEVPAALSLIVTSAFTGQAAVGGFAGAGIWAALRFGVARGVFSNEAGLGSAPIAHAAARTDSPVQQGMIAMLGTFIDTILLCTVTGLVIVISGVWQDGATGAALSTAAFESMMPGGQYVVSLGLAVFAFTTILGWSYYSERCLVYLFGAGVIPTFRVLWVLAVPLGALAQLDFVWLLADTLNALMALPNLVGLLLLSPLVFKLTREALGRKDGV